MKLSGHELIAIVLDSFEAERTNDVKRGMELVAQDFKQRSMVVRGEEVFPVFTSADIESDITQAYAIKGREFHVWNVAANEETQTVFVELVEVEPLNGRPRIWPYTLVCNIEDGKIKRSRHYGDPAILGKDMSVDRVRRAIND